VALATNSDIESRLGRPLTDAELERSQGLLDEASALVEGYCGQSFVVTAPLEVPSAVVLVVSKLAARGLTAGAEQPDVTTSQYTAGPFQFSQNFAGDGSRMWIGSAERMMLRPFRIAMRSIPMVSDRGGWVEEDFL
jgi:hypothetical protein